MRRPPAKVCANALLGAGALLLALAPLGRAQAHVRWLDPPPRSDADGLTEGPCGGVSGGAPTPLTAGATIDVSWVVNQSHGNTFRVAFSPGDDLGYDDNVLGTLPDNAGELTVTQSLTLPACTCEACSLQLQQLTASGNAGYYSCADIRLVAADPLPACPAADPGETSADPSDTGDTSSTSGSGSTDAEETSSTAPDETSTTTLDDAVDETSTSDGSPPAGRESREGCGCSAFGRDRPRGVSIATWSILLLAGRGRRR